MHVHCGVWRQDASGVHFRAALTRVDRQWGSTRKGRRYVTSPHAAPLSWTAPRANPLGSCRNCGMRARWPSLLLRGKVEMCYPGQRSLASALSELQPATSLSSLGCLPDRPDRGPAGVPTQHHQLRVEVGTSPLNSRCGITDGARWSRAWTEAAGHGGRRGRRAQAEQGTQMWPVLRPFR